MSVAFVYPLPRIYNNYQGYSDLIQLAHELNERTFSQVTLDMSQATWFDANMCAPLGAILYRAARRLNTIEIEQIPPPVERILSKNGFLSNYGYASLEDTFATTIQYHRFEPKDDRFFSAYVSRHFQTKALPNMSEALLKKYWESIFEIFNNAVTHSGTRLGIYACGQFYPKKNCLDFSITDLGVGIRNNLKAKKGIDLPAEDAIQWAMEGRNTTKSGNIPGGLGLKLLQEFIRLNEGRIQVVSDRGYWEQRPTGHVKTKRFPYPFPGTVVNIEINTADTNAYELAGESSIEDIF